MFEKVLVCLDRSPESEAILHHIYRDARKFGRIVFLTVVQAPVVNLPVGVPGESLGPVQTRRMLGGFRKAMEEAPGYLEEKALPLTEQNIEVELAVLEGVPSETILEYVKDNRITLLAMATHGHSGLREIVMGSTAETLLKKSGIPVMMVKPEKKTKNKK